MRLFLAVDLAPAVIEEVRLICRDLAGARWSHLDQLHLTLRFWAALPDGELTPLQAALATVAQPAFTLGLRGLGVFPRGRRPPRVLWAGLAPEAPAVQLKAAIDDALGPDPEAATRGFSPHLTLARFRDDPGPALQRYLDAHVGFASTTWRAEAFHLYRSTLGAGGPTHERLRSYPLGA